LRRVGGNLNQAVKVLNVTGRPPPEFADAFLEAMEHIRNVDAVADTLGRRVRRRPTRRPPRSHT
jgi:hypothetical protein